MFKSQKSHILQSHYHEPVIINLTTQRFIIRNILVRILFLIRQITLNNLQWKNGVFSLEKTKV